MPRSEWSLNDLSERDACLRVTGADAVDYLHRMTTAGLKADERAIPTLYLTPKGRVTAPLVAWKNDSGFDLQVPRAALPAVKDGLERLVIMEDVALEVVDQRFFATIQATVGTGERLRQALSSTLGIDLPVEPHASCSIEIEGRAVDALVRPRSDGWGLDVSGAVSDWEVLRSSLLSIEGLASWSEEEAEVARVSGGWPRFGLEVTDATIPQEAGLDAWVNFKKGCFVGQEVVSRMHHLGHPNKRLCRIRASEGLSAGDSILDPETDKEIGRLTSVAPLDDGSPQSVALGFVGWRHATADRSVRIEGASGRVDGSLEVLTFPNSCLQ